VVIAEREPITEGEGLNGSGGRRRTSGGGQGGETPEAESFLSTFI